MNTDKTIRVTTYKNGYVSLHWLGMGPHDVLPNKLDEALHIPCDTLPLWIQTSLATLMTLPPPPPIGTIEGVGMRVEDGSYWVEDKGDWTWQQLPKQK